MQVGKHMKVIFNAIDSVQMTPVILQNTMYVLEEEMPIFFL
jgi:hypothetical protein